MAQVVQSVLVMHPVQRMYGLVDGVARIPLALGAWVRHLQSGLVQRYALVGVLGTLLIMLALAARLR